MIRLGITGHRGLPAATRTLVDVALRSEIQRHHRGPGDAEASASLVGVSCLADGADELFAQAVLDLGGTLVAVLPARDLRPQLPPDYLGVFDSLLARALEVVCCDYERPEEEAYMAASARMVNRVDHLLAVWDGKPAQGLGGTADVVAYAREHGVPYTVIWPQGCSRQ